VQEIIELKGQGLTISAISELTGNDRKTGSICANRKARQYTDGVSRDRAKQTGSSRIWRNA
jgi:hypothetical protein